MVSNDCSVIASRTREQDWSNLAEIRTSDCTALARGVWTGGPPRPSASSMDGRPHHDLRPPRRPATPVSRHRPQSTHYGRSRPMQLCSKSGAHNVGVQCWGPLGHRRIPSLETIHSALAHDMLKHEPHPLPTTCQRLAFSNGPTIETAAPPATRRSARFQRLSQRRSLSVCLYSVSHSLLFQKVGPRQNHGLDRPLRRVGASQQSIRRRFERLLRAIVEAVAQDRSQYRHNSRRWGPRREAQVFAWRQPP